MEFGETIIQITLESVKKVSGNRKAVSYITLLHCPGLPVSEIRFVYQAKNKELIP